MKSNGFSLAKHPWLFLLAFILAIYVCSALIALLPIVVLKLPGDAPTTGLWVTLLTHGLMAFIFAPFVMGFHERSRPYTAYLSEIRLTHVQPVLKLFLLGVSCYLLLALSQVAGTLFYRLSQDLVVDLAFIRSAFPVASEFPPRSWGFLVSLTSIL